MQATDTARNRQMAPRRHRVLHGLKHRLICSTPGITLAPAFGFFGLAGGSAFDLLPVVAALIMAVLGFLAPTILTEGWNTPFPPAGHLALITRRTQRRLSHVAMGCLALPPLVRLVGQP